MRIARFFVTCVVLLGTLSSVACGNKKDKKKTDTATMQSLKAEGAAKWEISEVLGKDLAQAYRIMILDYAQRMPSGALIESKTMGHKFNWGRLTLAERQAAKEKLAQYVTAVSRLVEMDARKGVYLTNMDKVRSRYEGALAFQASLTKFEEIAGEMYEPKVAGQAPIYFAPVNI